MQNNSLISSHFWVLDMNTFTESCVMRVSVVLYFGGVFFVVVGHYIPDLQIFLFYCFKHTAVYFRMNSLSTNMPPFSILLLYLYVQCKITYNKLKTRYDSFWEYEKSINSVCSNLCPLFCV